MKRKVRLTQRGVGLLTLGVLLVLAGTSVGFEDVVLVGALCALPPATSWLVQLLVRPQSGRSALRVRRTIRPLPAQVGTTVQVSLTLTPLRATAAALVRLRRSTPSENIAPELHGRRPVRARVRTTADTITIDYELVAARRGRWSVGPAVVTRSGAFGLATVVEPLGEPLSVPVWPPLLPVDVGHAGAAASLAVTRSGARDPSDEDSSLREYQPGDDLRRVHWLSAARHETLMVRTDEGAGRPRACVIIDPPVRDPDHAGPAERITDWTVSVAASLAAHLLERGHPTRLVSTEAPASQSGVVGEHGTPVWHRGADELAALLDLTPDVRARVAGAAERAAVLDHLAPVHGEHVLAVLGAPDVEDLLALPVGVGTRRALLVESPGHPTDAAADRLTAAGWHVVSAPVGADPSLLWLRGLVA